MKSLGNIPELTIQHIQPSPHSEQSNSPSKYSLYSVRNRKASEDSISTNSPIRLKGLEFSPEKMEPFFLSKRTNVKRKGSTGYELELCTRAEAAKLDRNNSNTNEVKLFCSPPKNEKESPPLSKLRIIPDGYLSPQKTKFSTDDQQSSPFLKKHHPLEQTKPFKESFKEKQLFKDAKLITFPVNQLSDTVDKKHPFYNCKLTESYADPSTSSYNIKIEESVILQRSVLDSFRIFPKSEVKFNSYTEMIGIENNIGLAVSLKKISISEINEISNEIKILNTIGENCVHVVKHYTSLVEKSQYIFIREYYEVLLRDMLSIFNQENIKELCRQMLTAFEFFTSIKLVYKGNFFANICCHRSLYKLRNFELCTIQKQTPDSNLKRKYLGVLREMIRVLLGIDSTKPYYSKKLKRDLKPQTIVFMNDLIKNGVSFKQLKEHDFLSN